MLVDTSASQHPRQRRRHGARQRLGSALARRAGGHLGLRPDDDGIVDEGHKASAILNWKKLEERRSLGASDLQQALAVVAANKTKYARGLLISDGVITAGPDALADAVKATGARRFDAIAVGGIRDRDALGRLVMGGGLVVDGELPSALIAKKLNHKTLSGLKVAVPGAEWVWPETLDNMQPGEPALIYADLAADKPFSISIDGKAIGAGALKRSERPLLERAWVAARIKRLLDQKERTADKDMKAALTKQAIELSTTHRVLCPLTALLVLETEADYARFHIDRNALSSILAVENGKIVVNGRKGTPVVKKVADKTPVRPVEKVAKFKVKADEAEGSVERDKDRPSVDDGAAPSHAMAGKAARRSRDDDADAFDAREESKVSDLSGAASGSAGGAASGAAMAPQRGMPSPSTAPAQPAAEAAPTADIARSASPRDAGESGESRNRLSNATPQPVSVARPEPPPPPAPSAAKTEIIDPYTGQFRLVMKDIRHKSYDEALAQADGWWHSSPGDVMALVALGEALEAKGDLDEASRAYGSLIDLFPARADMRRFAGQRLERLSLKNLAILRMAIDTYAKAEEQRPDHPQSHRLLAYALLRQDEPEKAFDVLEKGARYRYPSGRFAGVDQIFAEDLGIAAQVWIKKEPARKEEIYKRLANAGGHRETAPSLRFILSWETDANDVDFHIFDSKDGHAFYSSKELPSGGELYADVTTGYGPECFTIRGKPSAAPYKLQAHYYSRGPMGYGMGKLEIVQHDGKGGLKFDERPFVVMQDQAFLDLGSVGRSL